MSSPLVILEEDADCLAVAKPAGQFTQGTWAPPGEMTLEQSVRRYLDPDHPESAYLGIVHRLDRPTSGVLLWAKTPKAARRLSAQFESRRVVKEYWAIVELGGSAVDGEGTAGRAGPPDPAGGTEETWSDWLTRTSRTGTACVVAPGTTGARPAVTRAQRSAARGLAPGLAWIRLWPQTGRTHQLRAQAAARGMPILGDSEYGSGAGFGGPNRIALHARSLRIRHPILLREMTLVAPIPAEWHALGVGGAGWT
jgi:23S rRNA pseudouridine1911/1915/1917 synthase